LFSAVDIPTTLVYLKIMSGCEALKKYRADRGLTQEQAAAEVGVFGVSWSRWETGQRRVGRSVLAVVSEKTGIPPRELRPDLAEMMGGQ
jgi:transcriptional regulator with XRE-family HTH domain